MNIRVPVDPHEKHLPRSDVRYETLCGQMISILNVPIQGPQTLQNLLDTLRLWKPNLVQPEPEYHI